jgi:hypothetical protein
MENKCDFCNKNEAVGIYSTHLPISLAYCQDCLDAQEIRTRHNVHMNWLGISGDEYLNNDYTVYFKDKYINIKQYVQDLSNEDVEDFYKTQTNYCDQLKEKIKFRNENNQKS